MAARRGGRHQPRLAHDGHDGDEHGVDMQGVIAHAARRDLFDSQLAHELVMEWSWGSLSAVAVQKKANLAYKDQVTLLDNIPPEVRPAPMQSLKSLAELGTSGRHVGNCNRDLISWLEPPDSPAPSMHEVDVKIPKPSKFMAEGMRYELHYQVRSVSQAFFLPHVQFGHIFNKQKHVWDENILGGSADRLEEFWNGVELRGDPRLHNHPMVLREGWKRHAVPIAIHADAVPCVSIGRAGTKSLDVFSWQSVIGKGGTEDVKHVMYSVFNQCKSSRTMEQVWAILLWSLWFFVGRDLAEQPS